MLNLFLKNVARSIAIILFVTTNHFVYAQKEAASCNDVIHALVSSKSDKRTPDAPEAYVSSKMFNLEETKKVISIARSYSRKKLLSMIPEEYFVGVSKEDILQERISPFQANSFEFFHGTNFENAISIYKNQRLELTEGVYNRASASLAATENFYPVYMKITETVRAHKNTVFKVELQEKAKILDLRKDTYGGFTTSINFSKAFNEWFFKNFDDIIEEFDELSQLRAEMIKNDPEEGAFNFDDIALNVETFGHLLGADLLMVTRKYGQRYNEEFSLINPAVVSEILPHIGRDPREIDRTKVIDYSFGRKLEAYRE